MVNSMSIIWIVFGVAKISRINSDTCAVGNSLCDFLMHLLAKHTYLHTHTNTHTHLPLSLSLACCRDFGYVARDQVTKKHKCHVFRCDMPARAVAKVLLENHQKLSKAPPTAATVTAAGSDEGGKEGEQAKTAGATITETWFILNVFTKTLANSKKQFLAV